MVKPCGCIQTRTEVTTAAKKGDVKQFTKSLVNGVLMLVKAKDFDLEAHNATMASLKGNKNV